MFQTRSKSFILLFAIAFLVFPVIFPVQAQSLAGNLTGGRPAHDAASSFSPQSILAGQSLSQVISEYGKIKLSLDALGTLAASGNIHVEKPAGATVRKAFLMAATTGFLNNRLTTGRVTLLGNSVVWEREISTSISSYNYWADVTAVVKSTIDDAPAGLVNIGIGEISSAYIDGEILAVIFDDPNQTQDNTVQLYFGSQDVGGDSFVIDFGMPIDKSDPNLVLDYSLGISYGCQAPTSCSYPRQYSIVNVNDQRLTTSAGGEDDGSTANGALITVGGIGDTHDNPADPNALPVNQFSDDELYDLIPFVNDGDSSVTISTSNPSADDNILFAALTLGSTRSVVNIDVDISLYNNPSTAEARAPYENMIRYMADGVYESSNGAHQLGKVTFHPSNAAQDKADVVWVEKCHPNGRVSGFGTDGLHINMCDIFTDSNGKGSDYNFLEDDGHQKGGGYTLAHEWGHYYYSLYDEYVGSTEYDTIFHFPHSTDKAVQNSIMNSQWNAVGGDFNWLNFSIAKNDTEENAQHRVYQATAWDTLTRPVSDDPRDGDRLALPARLFHTELRDVKPAENEDARIDLPGSARKALSITWASAPAASSGPALTLPLSVQLTSIYGQNISYPNPILMLAFVHRDLTIINMGVNGHVHLPDGTEQPVVFSDDGISPDAVAGDGLYSAILNYQLGGLYTVEVLFNNNDNQASFVANAFSPTADVNGNPVPLPAPIPVNEPFEFSKSLQIMVSNVVPDDYGNTPDESYMINPDNASHPGKIDYAGDIDVFQFTTTGAWVNFLRVTDLAFGCNPQLRILASDKTTVLFSAALDRNDSEYLFIPLSGLPAGTTVYAELSDQLGMVSGGLYNISAGGKLNSDALFTKYFYLPVIIR